jgi:FdhD protein
MAPAKRPRPMDGAYPIVRWPPHAGVDGDDDVAAEEPLEIRVDGAAVAVTMRTPGDDDELAAGFCLTEGIVAEGDEIDRVEVCNQVEEGNVVDVRLDGQHRELAIDRSRRMTYLSSSCGICGKQTLDRIEQSTQAFDRDAIRLPAAAVADLPQRMRREQAVFSRTGGLHAAALFTVDAELIVLREDVGRHNAVDKVIGFCLLQGLQRYKESSVLLVSGRVSFEIVQKAAVARIPAVAAVSAPTTLAIDLARRLDMTLLGFVRDGRFNIYSGAHRIV